MYLRQPDLYFLYWCRWSTICRWNSHPTVVSVHLCPAAVLSSPSASCWGSTSLPPSRSMSSANHKLRSCRLPMNTDDSGMWVSSAYCAASSPKQSVFDGCWGIKVFCIIFSNNTLNSIGDNGHHCCAPTVIQKKSLTLPPSNTAPVASSHNYLITSISRSSVIWIMRVPLPGSVLSGLPACWESLVTWPYLGD